VLLTDPTPIVYIHTTGMAHFRMCCVFDSITSFLPLHFFVFLRLLETKKWSGRNEVIETSGRLHPLWPQDKRLHTPRSTDYRHTRKDKWIDGTGFNTCKECHKIEPLWNHTTTDHKEEEQLEDRLNVGESSCNFGDGTDQRVQSFMFMMMMMMMMNFFITERNGMRS